MIATGVPYANELNTANALYGVSQAVLQAMLDYEGVYLFGFPDERMRNYAREYARIAGKADDLNDSGALWPQANIVSTARYLQALRDRYGSGWTAVAVYYGGGPVGEQIATRIARLHYPAREAAWRV